MAQLDRLLATLFEHPGGELQLMAGAEPTITVGDKAFALVPRVLHAAQVRFLIDEVLNDAARHFLETHDGLDFGYTPPNGRRAAATVRAWRGETAALFRVEEPSELFRTETTSTKSALVLRPSEAKPLPLAPLASREAQVPKRTPSLPNLPPAVERAVTAASTSRAAFDDGLDSLLRRLVADGASDLHLSTGQPPRMRRDGSMVRLSHVGTLSEAELMGLVKPVMPARNREQFELENDTDFAHEIAGLARFRVNVFRDRLGPAIVVRVIPRRLATASELGLPPAVRALCGLSKGLVLVTGPTGSGKSTTLAALVDLINEQREDHIMTLEDPIEFVHVSKKCMVNQREVGSHTTEFKRGLRAALREDPDIVLVGEMRDLETVAIAIETAETGHLVFGTLHTTTAASTVDRVIDQFPADRQAQIRVMLAESLKAVVAQTLCKRIGGGRAAALEVLLVTPAISNLIREGKTFQIPSTMQTSRKIGMTLLNDSLFALVQSKVVAPKEAHRRAVDKAGLLAMFTQEGIPFEVEASEFAVGAAPAAASPEPPANPRKTRA